jgi:hypothetical protein
MRVAALLLAVLATGICAWVVIADHRPTSQRVLIGLAALSLAIFAFSMV